MFLLAILAALAAGAANPFQSATNAELNKHLDQPLLAGLWVYASGLLGVLLLALCVRQFSSARLGSIPGAMAHVPWWAWMGGLISIASTMAGLMLAQKLGSGVFTGLSITASIIVSVLLDQFGWIGFKQHTASPGRIAGCTLLVAGVWLVSRY